MTTANDAAFVKELMADLARLGRPDTVSGYRSFLVELLEDRKNAEPMPKVGAYHRDVPLGVGLTAHIAVPSGKGPFPVMLVCHGNGGLAGSAQSYRRFTHDLAMQGYVTVTPDYRLAPENRHPADIEDMIQAVAWLRDHVPDYGGDPDRVVFVGDSSGAALALSLILRLIDSRAAGNIKALVGIEGGYSRLMRSFFTDAYMPEGYSDEDLKSPMVSPIMGITEELNLPPILLITGSADPAARTTFELATKLLETRHHFALHLLEGMPHDFMKFPNLDGYREGHQLMSNFLKQYVAGT